MTRLQKEPRTPPSSVRTATGGSNSSSFYEYVYRKRFVLSILSLLVTIGMVIGLLFVAHYYYHMWGGQGFLRSRTIERALDSIFFADNDSSVGTADVKMDLYLPMRKTNEFDDVFFDGDHELRRAIPTGSPPNNTIPFYVCGDQAEDCEAFGQPNICCPVDYVCHSTSKKITSSGIYCCHFNSSASDCQSTSTHKPQCLPNSFECPSFSGGGCCPAGSQCINQTTTTTTITSTFPLATSTKILGGGCALYIGNSGGQSLTTTTSTSSSGIPSSTTWSPDFSNIIEQSTTSVETTSTTSDPDKPTPTGGPAGGLTTATFLGAPTGTAVREGEVALKGAGAGVVLSGKYGWFLGRSPQSMGIWLVIVAVAFARL